MHIRCKRCRFHPWVGKIPLEEGMATHSSILTWWSPWTEEPGGLRSIGLQAVGHHWSNSAACMTCSWSSSCDRRADSSLPFLTTTAEIVLQIIALKANVVWCLLGLSCLCGNSTKVRQFEESRKMTRTVRVVFHELRQEVNPLPLFF